MPPQMFLDEKFDGTKADIFSLGVTLFILVTNEKPFNIAYKVDELYKLIKSHQYKEFWDKLNIKRKKQIEVSKEFKELFIKMVDFNEDKRPDIKTILKDKWFNEIKDLSDEKKLKLEKDYIQEFTQKEKKMNDQLKPTVKVKAKNDKKEAIKKQLFTNENNIICVENEKIFDNYIKIKGHLNIIGFMNEFATEMGNIYDGIETIGQELKFILIKKKEDKNDKDYNYENSEEIEKELNIQVELFKVKDDEFILNFRKKKGKMDDYYEYLSRLIKYAQDFI